MNYATIKYCDIANGVGVRTTLFVSGCRLHCPNCFNSEAWDFTSGEPFTPEVEDEIVKSLEPAYVEGLSVLGGEPMEPENQAGLVDFLEHVRATYPKKSIWMYSGHTWEQLTGSVSSSLAGAVGGLLERPEPEMATMAAMKYWFRWPGPC